LLPHASHNESTNVDDNCIDKPGGFTNNFINAPIFGRNYAGKFKDRNGVIKY
jgi:hypothetical protein